MAEQHLDIREFERLEAGELSQEETARASRHLLSCRHCRSALGQIASQAAEELKVLLRELVPDPSLASAPGAGDNRAVRDSMSTGPAELLEELRHLPRGERASRVREHRRFHHLEMVQALLDESWSLPREDPAASEEFARCALEAARRLEGAPEDQPRHHDLQARAWASIGNARRVRSHWAAAQKAFEQADAQLAQGTRDPVLRAEVLHLESILRREQRRFAEAEKTIDQALAIYRWARDRGEQCSCLISKARIFELSGEPERAVVLLQEAGDLLDSRDDSVLLFCVWGNLVHCLLLAGEPQEARDLLPAVCQLATEVGQRYDVLRVRWLEGLVARDLGETEKAEAVLQAVRKEFVRDGMGYDAALASLDLAAMFLQQGRTAETKKLAREMLRLFESLDIQREAFAALILFQQAALREKATVQMVRDIAACLQRAGTGAALRYETPS